MSLDENTASVSGCLQLPGRRLNGHGVFANFSDTWREIAVTLAIASTSRPLGRGRLSGCWELQSV